MREVEEKKRDNVHQRKWWRQKKKKTKNGENNWWKTRGRKVASEWEGGGQL